MAKLWLVVACICLSALALGCSDAGDSDGEPPKQSDAAVARPDANTGPCGGCNSSQECCSGFCAAVLSDTTNCGGCDVVCDPVVADTCSNGSCSCAFSSPCTEGSTCCPSTGCKDLSSDPDNCGICGSQCGVAEACVEGQCVCAATGTVCEGGTICCESGCVDTSTDADNCGGCGLACDGEDVCTGGACNCEFTCPEPQLFGSKIVCCGDGCYDICTDVTHCGGCDATECTECDLGGCDGAGPDLANCFFSLP